MEATRTIEVTEADLTVMVDAVASKLADSSYNLTYAVRDRDYQKARELIAKWGDQIAFLERFGPPAGKEA